MEDDTEVCRGCEDSFCKTFDCLEGARETDASRLGVEIGKGLLPACCSARVDEVVGTLGTWIRFSVDAVSIAEVAGCAEGVCTVRSSEDLSALGVANI